MRTLKLTHEQIGIIQHALGIAENQILAQAEAMAKLESARGSESNRQKLKSIRSEIIRASYPFSDLNESIGNGSLDI